MAKLKNYSETFIFEVISTWNKFFNA